MLNFHFLYIEILSSIEKIEADVIDKGNMRPSLSKEYYKQFKSSRIFFRCRCCPLELVEPACTFTGIILEGINIFRIFMFVRMWDLYLSSCAATFHNGIIDVHQILLTIGINNDLPQVRWY